MHIVYPVPAQDGARANKPGSGSVTAEAERLRDELDVIGHVISHDVRAPVRTIVSNCDELSERLLASNDMEARALVEQLRSEADRMKAMTEGLLDYIRLETYAPTLTLLDSNELLGDALKVLEEEIQGTGARIIFDQLPKVMGHRGRLTRLFAHLLNNALKFRGKDSPAIRITHSQLFAEQVTFCVEDNGIGIDEENAEIIFTLFKRLHGADAYPGYGIGLALSRKIVEAHEGKIWVDSRPGVGSRFYFTLPVAKT